MTSINQTDTDVRLLNMAELDAVTGAGGRPPLKGTGTRIVGVPDCSVPGRRCNEFKPTANNGAYVWVGDHWERAKSPY